MAFNRRSLLAPFQQLGRTNHHSIAHSAIPSSLFKCIVSTAKKPQGQFYEATAPQNANARGLPWRLLCSLAQIRRLLRPLLIRSRMRFLGEHREQQWQQQQGEQRGRDDAAHDHYRKRALRFRADAVRQGRRQQADAGH